MKYKRVQVLGNRLWIRKCYVDHIRGDDGNVLLYRTDYGADTTTWAEIKDVGPKCKIFTKEDIGSFVMCPEQDNTLKRMFNEDFAISEDKVLPLVVEN